MSVLIKGMEMPTSCRECWLKMNCDDCEGRECYCLPLQDEIGYLKDLLTDKRRDDCPLVPVPPHGRLIDADAYEALIRGLGNGEYRRDNGTICDAIKFLHPHYAPTIIPASEEGE